MARSTPIKILINNEEREPLDQDDEKSESEEITEQGNPNILHNKTLHNYCRRFSS